MPSSGSCSSSSTLSITVEIRLAEAAHLVYMTNIRERDIIAMEIKVKYCINAITVVAEDCPVETKYAATAITATMPPFINSVITGLTTPMMTPALVSLFFKAELAFW